MKAVLRDDPTAATRVVLWVDPLVDKLGLMKGIHLAGK
jgi:hypothetical protein